MPYRTTKHKIKTIYDLNLNNSFSLDSKANKNERLQKEQHLFKSPTTLHDSGWFNSEILSTNLLNDIDLNQYAYVVDDLLAPRDGSSRPNIEYPISLSFGFQQSLDISSDLLPFVKVQLLTKTHPNLRFAGFFINEDEYRWNRSNYFRILGDSTVVYQGYSPPTNAFRKYTEEQILDGTSTFALTSKWFTTPSYSSCIEYTVGAETHKLVGDLYSVFSYYNVVYVPDVDDYNYESFQSVGFSSVGSFSVTGKGTHVKAEWVEIAPGNWQKQLTSTKNVTKTVPIGENSTQVQVRGLHYKDGVLQAGLTHSFITIGDILSFGTATATQWNLEYQNYRKIFYTSDWAVDLRVNPSTFLFTSFPYIDAYQTGTLPYTQLSFIVNPNDGDYPLEEETTYGNVSAGRPIWAKITQDNESPEKYRLYFRGQILYISPTNSELTQDFDYVNEDYESSGYSYTRVAENRPGKSKSTYIPTYYSVKLRLLISLEPPLEFFTNYSYVKEES